MGTNVTPWRDLSLLLPPPFSPLSRSVDKYRLAALHTRRAFLVVAVEPDFAAIVTSALIAFRLFPPPSFSPPLPSTSLLPSPTPPTLLFVQFFLSFLLSRFPSPLLSSPLHYSRRTSRRERERGNRWLSREREKICRKGNRRSERIFGGTRVSAKSWIIPSLICLFLSLFLSLVFLSLSDRSDQWGGIYTVGISRLDQSAADITSGIYGLIISR